MDIPLTKANIQQDDLQSMIKAVRRKAVAQGALPAYLDL